MEVILLFVGLVFSAVGIAIIVSEMQARRGTQSVPARVIGFSKGRTKSQTAPSFHSVAEYVGLDGRTYYIEGAIGSSVPLHVVGEAVTVLVHPTQSGQAVFKSALSFLLGAAIAAMGAISLATFWLTFRPNRFSLIMALVVSCGLTYKIKQVWRKTPLSFEQWREYKQQIVSPRVFTNESKGEIVWADPISVRVAKEHYQKANRFAIPLLLVLGAAFLIFGQLSYKRTEAFLQGADRVRGEVIDLKETESDDSSTYAAVVEYFVDGQRYKLVDRFSSNPPAYEEGQPVVVVYRPDNPAEAQIDRGRWNHWLAILLGSSGGLFVLLGLCSARRRFRT
jgi:hypothetical protein